MFGYVNFARRCIRSVDAYASTRSHSFPFVSRRLGGFWLFGRSWCRWLVSGSPCPRGARSPWLGRALVWLVVAGSRSVSVGSLAGSWFLGCSVPWFSLRRVEMNASPSCPIVLNGSDGGLVGFARRSCGVVPWGPCRVLLSVAWVSGFCLPVSWVGFVSPCFSALLLSLFLFFVVPSSREPLGLCCGYSFSSPFSRDVF